MGGDESRRRMRISHLGAGFRCDGASPANRLKNTVRASSAPAAASVSNGRRAVRAAIVCLLAVAASFFAEPAGAAETLVLRGDRDAQAWFWSSNRDIRQCTPKLPPPAPPDALCTTQDLSSSSPISPGHLGVALNKGASDMRTYLLFDIGEIPDGSTVGSAVLELTVSRAGGEATHTQTHGQPGGKAPATTNEAQAKIKACLVTLPWGSSEGAPPSTMDPSDPTKTTPAEPILLNGVDCDTATAGKRGETWTFDLKAFVQKWTSGTVNYGVVLQPAEAGGPADSWIVEFHGGVYTRRIQDPSGGGGTQEITFVREAESSKFTVTFTSPPREPEPTFEPPLAEPPAGPGPVAPPLVDPAVGSDPVPPPGPATGSQFPVAASNPRTPWYLWLMIPGGLVGFVALSRGMGREAGEAGGNRVAAMLRRKRTGE